MVIRQVAVSDQTGVVAWIGLKSATLESERIRVLGRIVDLRIDSWTEG